MRVLVVEDEGLIAMALCDELVVLGYEPVGPFVSLEAALEAAGAAVFDLALVDINLKGELGYPIVDALIAAAVPVALMTAYSDSGISGGYAELPRLEKPFSTTTICETLTALQTIGRELPIHGNRKSP